LKLPPLRPVPAACLLALLAAAAGLAFLAAFPAPPPHDDALEYLALARNLAAGNGFSQDGITPAVYRPPLFSGLLGGWYFLTGTDSVASAAVFQALVHAAGAAAAFFLLLELVPIGWAFGGAAALALHPVFLTRVALVLQEPTLVLSTAAAALATVRLLRAPTAPRAVLAGLAWGACILAKLVAAFVPPMILLLRLAPAPSLRIPLPRREAALLLLSAALAVAPWTVRNALRFDRLIPVNGEGAGMLAWNVVETPVEGDAGRDAFVAEVRRGGLESPEARGRAWRFILDHPREFLLERTIRNAVRFAAPPRDWWIARGAARPGDHPPSFWLLALALWVPPFAALGSATRSLVRGRVADPGLRFLLFFYWAYWAEHALVWGDPRFGLAAFPALLAIALSEAFRLRSARIRSAG
jgi:4-amino-4-deoxy-L-arabinose transferase-like glycosyltransferase